MKRNCMKHFDIKPESDLVCILVVDVLLCIFSFHLSGCSFKHVFSMIRNENKLSCKAGI